MKTLKSIALATLTLCAVSDLQADDTNNTFVVTAFIDGTSRLVVSSNSIYWDNIDFYWPGTDGTQNFPTYLDGFPWWPEWPPGMEYRTRVTNSAALSVQANFHSDAITLRVLSGRCVPTVHQQPKASEGVPLIVEFDHGPFVGAEWLKVAMTGLAVDYNAKVSLEVAAVALRWFAKSNRWFQPQYSTSIFQPVWENLGSPVYGTGGTQTVTDNALDIPRRFYRVLTLP